MMKEMELTPQWEERIRQEAARLHISVELLRYYCRYGVDAPDWPQPSRKARRWLRQLRRSA